MNVRLGILMDPIGSIKIHKDSSFAMLLAAQSRGWELIYMELGDLYLLDGEPFARARTLRVTDDPKGWHELGETQYIALRELDVILMRKDPPMDMEYIYATHMLERAESLGTLIVNRPASIRDVNEKLKTAWFPQCCTPTLVSSDSTQLREFLHQHGDVILKPLNNMGGASIFRVTPTDPNLSVILETMTLLETETIMAQRYVPEISAGDKRILIIDGEPVPYALARIPAAGESRGNLAAGGHGEGVELSTRDSWICEQVGPMLREKGLLFVGIDVIGDYLTEINVTSPTCIRELDRIYGLDIAAQLMDCIEGKLSARS